MRYIIIAIMLTIAACSQVVEKTDFRRPYENATFMKEHNLYLLKKHCDCEYNECSLNVHQDGFMECIFE